MESSPFCHQLVDWFFIYQLSIAAQEIKEKKIDKIVKIDIKNKNQVGSDRIANAAGVYKKYRTNCIVLDFGTATTFDVITKQGVYNGGIIAPGVNLSLNSLVKSAQQIPIFSILLHVTLVPLSKIHVFPGELGVQSQTFLSFVVNHMLYYQDLV